MAEYAGPRSNANDFLRAYHRATVSMLSEQPLAFPFGMCGLRVDKRFAHTLLL